MTDLTLPVRENAFQKERTYTLGPDELTWRGPGGEGRVGYADVGVVRLFRYPRLFALKGSAPMECTLRGSSGDIANLSSSRFAGFGKTQDMRDVYIPFVRELCIRVVSANRLTRFATGNPRLRLGFVALLALYFSALALAVANAVNDPERPMGILIGFAVIAPVILPAIPIVKNARLRPFDPRNPPEEFLG